MIVQFGEDPATWFPDPISRHRLRVEVQLHKDTHWKELVSFDWWAPCSKEVMGQFVTHRNEFVGGPFDLPAGHSLSSTEGKDGGR